LLWLLLMHFTPYQHNNAWVHFDLLSICKQNVHKRLWEYSRINNYLRRQAWLLLARKKAMVKEMCTKAQNLLFAQIQQKMYFKMSIF